MLAAVLAATFVLLAYPMVGIVREVLGQPGIATSPLITALVLWLVAIPLIHLEPRLQRRPSWSRIEPWWYGGAVALGFGLPLVAALVWPLPVLTGLPRGVAGALCFLPMPLVAAAVIARGRRRRRRGRAS